MVDWDNLIADETMLMPIHYTPGRSDTIRGIVLHHNAANLSIRGCYETWQTREASAHYQVDINGRIGQLVNDSDTAWHAGAANPWTIGIEHADNNFGPWTISDATLESGAHLVAALCRYYQLGRPQWLVNVYPHSYFMQTACPGEIAGSQNAQYMRRAQEWYDAMMNGDEMVSQNDIQAIANAVVNYDLNGVKLRDRIIGTDGAANNAAKNIQAVKVIADRNDSRLSRILLSLKRFTGLKDDDTTSVPDLTQSWLDKRIYRLTLIAKKAFGLPDDSTAIPDTLTLSDATLDAIADRVIAKLDKKETTNE